MEEHGRLFLNEHRARGSSPRTIEGYLRDLNRFRTWLTTEGRPTAIGEVRREDIVLFLDALLNLQPSERRRNPAGTAHMVFRSLRAFFNWAAEQEIIPTSPMRHVKGPRVPEVPIPILDEDEIRRLLDTCRRGKTPEDRRDYALLRTFLDTGARLGEIVGLRIDDYQVEDGLLTIRHETSKSRRTRTVSLSTETQVALGRWITLARPRYADSARERAFWVSPKGALTDSGVAKILQRRARAAGINRVHPHMFRHTFAHHALANGHTEGDVMRRGGWRSRSMLDRYGRTGASDRSNDAFRASGFGDRW